MDIRCFILKLPDHTMTFYLCWKLRVGQNH
jgi:hypothetical protein